MRRNHVAAEAIPGLLGAFPRRVPWHLRMARLAAKKPLGAASAAVVATLVLSALAAPWLAPFNPYEITHPVFAPPGTGPYLLGTDNFGRDLLSRVIYGARISLWVGIVAVSLGTMTGTALGLVSGYWEGKIDLAIQRVIDALMAFPTLVLAMAIMAVLGQGITNVMIAVAIVWTPGPARVIRGAVLTVKQNEYVEAARVVGCSQMRIVMRHLLPNVAALVIVLATIGLGDAILVEASLSFLGLGAPPPQPSWGSMLSWVGRTYMFSAPWVAIFPGIAITLSVLGFNLLGDAFRDVWDPRLRGH